MKPISLAFLLIAGQAGFALSQEQASSPENTLALIQSAMVEIPGSENVHGFSMMSTEVTNEMWDGLMEDEDHPCPKCPRSHITLGHALIFIERLNRLSEDVEYELPTVEEWNYAAQGGEWTRFKYAGSNSINKVGWHKGNSGGELHPVGMLKPNKFGLFDMTGNVIEWTSTETEDGGYYFIRGGAASEERQFCLLNYEITAIPDVETSVFGFRLVSR